MHPVAPHDIDLFHAVAIVKVPEAMRLGFDEGAHDLRACRPVMPSMFTLDQRGVRQDCPGYLMECCQRVAEQG